MASARLEKPVEVIEHYLKPAITHLQKNTKGPDAGRVFYEFAIFCDQQLQSASNLEDFRRLEFLRQRKLDEMQQLEALYHSISATNKEARSDIVRSRQKAKMWYQLDDNEFKQAVTARERFVRQSLTNYLQTLQACDDYDTSVVRFFALWLEHAESEAANEAVSAHLDSVPSWKFHVLINQIMSRLLQDSTLFQTLLAKLVTRLCVDHPYHTIHHLFSSCKSAVRDSDQLAKSRKAAAEKIASRLRGDKRTGEMVRKVWEANELYHRLAVTKIENGRTTKFSIRTIPAASQMNKRVSELGIPPATLSLELRPSGDYQHIPYIVRFREEVTIASGVSAPKVLTARASDGKQYKQLVRRWLLSLLAKLTSRSSKVVTMISDKMPSWSKSLERSARCSATTRRLVAAISRFVPTRFCRSARHLASSSSSPILCLCMILWFQGMPNTIPAR